MTKHTPDTLADSAFPVQTLHSETVFTGAIWDVTSERFTYPTAEGRSELRREYIHHPGAVAIIAMNEHNQVLLLQQYRHPVKQKLWEVPAGLLDHEGESMLQAAQRELAEEADLRARSWCTLVDYYTTPGSSSEGIRIFLATELSVVAEEDRHHRVAEEADMAQQWVDLDTATQLVFAGKLHNPSTVVAILALAAGGAAASRGPDAPWLPASEQK